MLIGGLVTTAGNHRCMLPDGGRVPRAMAASPSTTRAFPSWPRAARDAILQPPKPEIRPSVQVLERAADHDADWEAAD